MANPDHDTLIRIQSDWMGWSTADIRFGDVHDPHWFHPARAPRVLIHAYVWCSRIIAGQVPHQCESVSAPHRLRVCILKRHTLPSVYAELVRQADAQRNHAHQPTSES